MRVLCINSMFYTEAYRRCIDELGTLEGIDLTALTVDGWVMNERLTKTTPLKAAAPYSFVVGTALWKGKENRGFYISGLKKAFLLSRPDIIFLMEEPFSLFALQVLFYQYLYASSAPIVVFTWNNLSYEVFDYRPSLWYRLVSRWTLDRFAGALTANTDGIEALRNTNFANPIQKIGYGVETASFEQVEEDQVTALKMRLGLSPEIQVIGYVGRLLYMKGLDLLLKAFATVASDTTRLLIIGSGDYEAEMLRLADEYNIRSKLIHIQSVAHAEIPAYMHLLDILVLPSRRVNMWAEQFGRVLIEAQAAGAIVIGSSSGAIPEVMGEQGFVFEENNADSLIQTLHAVLSLPKEKKDELKQLARERVRSEFSWSVFAKRAASFLRHILDRG